ncbi:MAG: hypothetical protein NZ519_08295, partial [Bacteroidia bacterium]|nr:hypothetical protein [Bacteroidia bacterium]
MTVLCSETRTNAKPENVVRYFKNDRPRRMEYKNFIDNLSQNNANYLTPEQAINQANSLDLLSRDIYTDSERFIYELLQNADDASNQSGFLDVRIDIIGDFVIVSHKGEPFSKIDIESISSAGDGTKAGD